ncbi:MAG: hypothetical protein HEEMFOPI_01843 [Holosporales bacterium]
MVYINTLMIQEVLETKDLHLTKEDFRALSPLIHGHLTPYGYFTLDLKKRISLKTPANEGVFRHGFLLLYSP